MDAAALLQRDDADHDVLHVCPRSVVLHSIANLNTQLPCHGDTPPPAVSCCRGALVNPSLQRAIVQQMQPSRGHSA
jgi:hypothetical protein